MRGYKRFRSGGWSLVVDAGKDPITSKRRQVHRTFRAPNTKRGAAQADTALAKLIAEVEAGRALPSSGLTVAQLVERYIVDSEPRWAPGAAAETRRRVKQHITPYVGEMPIEKLRPIDVQQLHATLRSGGMAEGTIGRVHDIVRAAFTWAERLDLVARNPVAKVTRPRGAKANISPPAPKDVIRMIAKASPDLALFLRLAALTGARRGQLCALQWSDVQLDAATIRWTRSLVKVPGGTVEKETKTGARWSVALDPATVEALKQHRRRCVPLGPDPGAPSDDGRDTRRREPGVRAPRPR
jgi:integrase